MLIPPRIKNYVLRLIVGSDGNDYSLSFTKESGCAIAIFFRPGDVLFCDDLTGEGP